MRVSVKDGYAYVACWEDGFQIVDVSPIETAFIADSVPTPYEATYGIFVNGTFTNVADIKDGLRIIQVWQ